MEYGSINEQNLSEYKPTSKGISSIPIYALQKMELKEYIPQFSSADTMSFEDSFGIERLVLMPNHDGTGPRGGGKQDGSGNGNKGNQGTRNGGNQGSSGQGSKEGGRKGNC